MRTVKNVVRYDCPKCHMAMFISKDGQGKLILRCTCGHAAEMDSIMPYRGDGGAA